MKQSDNYRSIDVVENRWKNHVFLQPFHNNTLEKNNAAILLENTLKPIGSSDPAITAFERIRSDLTSQIFARMASRKFVSIQAQLDQIEQPTYLYLDTALRVIEQKANYITKKHPIEWNHKQIENAQSIHKYNVEVEIINMYANEIALCLDRTIVKTIMDKVKTNATWSFNDSLGDTVREKYESLYVKSIEVSNIALKKSGRYSPNWIISSPEICSIFETVSNFAPCYEDNRPMLGINYVGTLNARWRIYKDPLFKPDAILFGYQGDSIVDSGLFFIPHTLATINPNDKTNDNYPFISKYAVDFKPRGEDSFATITVEDFLI